jgi:predicted metal-dependent hydrolase
MEKNIFLEEVGEVRLRKSNRAHRISIRITPGGRVTVTIPAHSGWNAALRFLEQKKK